VGDWLEESSADDYGSNYLYAEPGSGDNKVIWEARVPEVGDYILYGWWPGSATNTTKATYRVIQPDGSEVAVFTDVDQTSGGSWRELGQFSISNPGPLAVILTDATDSGNIVADAVRIVSSDNEYAQIVENETSPSTHYSTRTILRRKGLPDIPSDQLRYKKLYIHSCQGRYYLEQYTHGVVFYSIPSIIGIQGQKWLKGVLQDKSDYELWQILQGDNPVFDYYDFSKHPWEQPQK
jgi:hypothetical protein